MSSLLALDPGPTRSASPMVTNPDSGLMFSVSCVPPKTSHHAKKIITLKTRDGRSFHKLGDKRELQDAKATLLSLFRPHQPPAPLTGPVALVIDLTWPWLAGDSKRVRALGRIPHDSKPDWDNAAKGIADCLVTLRFLEQDSRIVDGRVRKWRGDRPGITVSLRPVGREG